MPITRRDWIRSVRRGGLWWDIAAWLIMLAIAIGILKSCAGLP